MFETLMMWLSIPVRPSPAVSAAAALARGSAVAPTVRKTMARITSAARKPSSAGGTPLSCWSCPWVAGEFDLQRVTPQLRQVVVDTVEELLVIVRRLPGDV